MRVVLIDEQPLVREGLACILKQQETMVFCGSAASARQGFVLLEHEQPDLLITDLALSGVSGLAVTREARRLWPRMKIAILSASCCERDVLDALDAGAAGYFSKNDSIAALLTGLQAMFANDGPLLGPSIRNLALPSLSPSSSKSAPARRSGQRVLAAISDRERDVFELAVRGLRNREIARELCISIKTVGTHRLHINRKLGCSSTGELIYFAATNGLLSVPVGLAGRPTMFDEHAPLASQAV